MSNDSGRHPGLYKRARAAYAQLIGPIRAVAKEHGYAIGVHGSIARDIDMIAAPWVERPFTPGLMIEAIREICAEVEGFAVFPEGENPVRKPHGRMAWVIILRGGIYLDISVMSAIQKEESHA